MPHLPKRKNLAALSTLTLYRCLNRVDSVMFSLRALQHKNELQRLGVADAIPPASFSHTRHECCWPINTEAACGANRGHGWMLPGWLKQ